jgi:hypothetical protein
MDLQTLKIVERAKKNMQIKEKAFGSGNIHQMRIWHLKMPIKNFYYQSIQSAGRRNSEVMGVLMQLKKSIAFLSLLFPFSTFASTFTFLNKLENAVEIRWQLVGSEDKGETLVVPGRGEKSLPLEGAKRGLCMKIDNQTLSARTWPNGRPMYPLLISQDSFAYSELLKTNKITAVDIKMSSIDFERPPLCTDLSGTWDAAVKCNPQFAKTFGRQGRLCGDVKFEIRETDDHYLVFVLL